MLTGCKMTMNILFLMTFTVILESMNPALAYNIRSFSIEYKAKFLPPRLVGQKVGVQLQSTVGSGDSESVQLEDIEYDYQIKKAKKKHIKEISRLCVETFLGDGDDWLHISREKQSVARDLGNRFGAANTTFLIVEARPKVDAARDPPSDPPADLVVGFVEVASTREHCFVLAADVPFREYRSKVTSLVVDSAHRRKGIASQLLSACAKQSRLWSGHTELFLEVRNENEGAKLFYDKMGFRECLGAKDLRDKSNANIGLYILHNLPYD